jgi:hypothetical protein
MNQKDAMFDLKDILEKTQPVTPIDSLILQHDCCQRFLTFTSAYVIHICLVGKYSNQKREWPTWLTACAQGAL